jgi:branched-chain amino acid aminotransferase
MSVVPFDQRDGVIWFNGEFVPWKEAKVHVLTHALHYASAVFEGERAYGGEIFKLTEHTERLFASAVMLDMKIPYTVAEIDAACRETLKRQGFADAYVRPIAWRGSEMMGVSAQSNADQRGDRGLAVARLFRSQASRRASSSISPSGGVRIRAPPPPRPRRLGST